MSNPNPFSNLNFDLPRRRIPIRLLAIGAAFVIFTLLWLIVPQNSLYWLLLLAILCLSWAASFGWRPAVVGLIDLLHSLLDL